MLVCSLLAIYDHHERCLKTSKHGRCVGRRVWFDFRREQRQRCSRCTDEYETSRIHARGSEWPPGAGRSVSQYRRGRIRLKARPRDAIVTGQPWRASDPCWSRVLPDGWRRREHRSRISSASLSAESNFLNFQCVFRLLVTKRGMSSLLWVCRVLKGRSTFCAMFL